ncbi:hypothetical protein [Mycolicibacterium aichiense]|uniref:Uncharacterized protein n=1 Tax=Mycolicibacterium aichiense TaxID=1799 RepID=A0AAD1HJ51_9MYCO|nr:hypothetical protein [Mycolicibacterium aichiense]MCV7019205.1 hypothetical protein [Mycolicibacterium aichiense]BBX06357.1 hypothetical protein MAIC_11600 [Mycolicibacterium aichiense]STZ24304.1 Uncharacterised protein [Mycolicibacterium aichiense]
MEFAAPSRSLRTVATLTTVGALALTPVAVAPVELHSPGVPALPVSSQVVRLTDAWSDLLTNTVSNTVQLAGLFLGLNSGSTLPNPTIPLAPVATQLVLNQLIYTVQLFTGNGADIPGEIATHLDKLGNVAQALANDLPGIVVDQLRTPIKAFELTVDSVTTSGNVLLALLEAPAVFLDVALNSQYGLLGLAGPIAVPIIVRNLVATALETPLPTIVLPFKKPAAAVAPKPAAATVSDPADTASSARPKRKSPAANSKRKATPAKAGARPSGVGHGKR